MSHESIRVLFCTSDLPFAQIIGRALGPEFELRTTEDRSVHSGRAHLGWCDTVLLDLRPFGAGGQTEPATFQLMNEIRQSDAAPPIIAMLGADDHPLTRQAIENGAYDAVASPPDIVELRFVLRRAHRSRQMERELSLLRSRQQSAGAFGDFIVSTEPMRQVFALAHKVASCDVTVLITGETGTGKELLARAIHQLSARATGPFVAFSCANLPETLIEDELFGHEKGAFTGATSVRRGRFEVADQGTLFLDEIGDLALGLQAKLLRVLQQRSFERLGSNTSVSVNIRLVCATHRNLEEMVQQDKFRSDLYYRLNVVEIHIPPLRERRDGIAGLAQHFLMRFAKEFGKSVCRIAPLALRALEEHGWPGNVRELENVVQRAVVMAEGPAIELWHLPKPLHDGFEEHQVPSHSYDEELREFKRRLILRTLRDCAGSKAEAARRLGIARGYLHRLVNQLQIETEEGGALDDVIEEPDSPPKVM
jgi:DNA-binding NtrC family response regulator